MAARSNMRRDDRCPVHISLPTLIFVLMSLLPLEIAAVENTPQQNYRDARMLPSARNELSLADKPSGGEMDARVDCRVDGMFLVMNLGDKSFTGRVYPKGFSKTPCAQLYTNNGSRITYEVPMNTCNTMVNDFENGTREYHNMIVVQHHQTLVTKKDRSYAVRCRYRASEQLLQAGVGVDNMEVNPVEATAPTPIVEMSLLADASRQAEFVNIGDPLTMQLQIPAQRMYGILVHSCVVRDGAGVGGLQVLYDERGCPVEPDIMGAFQYKNDLTRATVTFKAHKFPYTTSLYYECHVQFCLKPTGECERLPTPPKCGSPGDMFKSSPSVAAPSLSPALGALSTNALDDESLSHLVTDTSTLASQTPPSTTAYTTIKFQPSKMTNNQQQTTLNSMRRGDPSRLPINSSVAENKDELRSMAKDQPQPSVAVEEMLLPSSLSTADQTVVKPATKEASFSSLGPLSRMKKTQIVVEEQQINVEPQELSTPPATSSSTSTTTAPITTTSRSITTTTPTARKTTTTVSPTTKPSSSTSPSVTALQQSRMLTRNDDEAHQPPVHEVIGFSSEASYSPTPSPPPPATTTARVITTASGNTGYAAVEPITMSEVTVSDGRQVYARKARSIAFAALPPDGELNNSVDDDDITTQYYEKLRLRQKKRKLEASLGGEVIEFSPKSAASSSASFSSVWEPQEPPHVETLIGYYNGAPDDDYDFIRSDGNEATHIKRRMRRITLTSSSSSTEVGRTAREAKVVRGLNVIDVSEPVPSYLMQAFKSQNGAGQSLLGSTNGNDSSNPQTPQFCMTTTTFAAGLSAAAVLCLLSAMVLGAAACSRCRRRREDESDILGSECAAAGGAHGEITSGHHLANVYSNSALFAAAVGYPTLTHGAASCSSPYISGGLMPLSPQPPNMSSNDSPVYRYSSYTPKGQYGFS